MILPTQDDMREIRGTVWRHPATEWDPVFGYRWSTRENRMVRVAHGEIVADITYQYNNYGQHCSFDYSPSKPSPHTYRIVVLGDSFTNDLMLPVAWPETLQQLLNSRKEFVNDFEVYSFPTDGGGLVNWHATFTKLIEPTFEFDALIIADWGDDLEREWIVIDWRDGQATVIRTEPDDAPKTREQVEALRENGEIIADLMPEHEIDALVKRLKYRAAPARVQPEDCPDDDAHVARVPNGYVFSEAAFIERYGRLRYDMLAEIIQTCHRTGKDVIYSPIPTREGLIHLNRGGEQLMPQAQGEWLCQHFGIHFFDGFAAFSDISSQSLIDFYWLKYDGHWNLGGSTHYALKLAAWMFEKTLFCKNASPRV